MLVGFIDAGHLRLGAALVWMVGMGKPGPGMANFAGICIGRHAERLVPADAGEFRLADAGAGQQDGEFGTTSVPRRTYV